MTKINIDTNNANNQDRLDPSGGDVEQGGSSSSEAQCLLNAFNHRFLLKSPNVQRRSRKSASLRSGGRVDGPPRRRPDPAHHAGGITQTRQITSSLTGIAQKHRHGYRGEPTSWCIPCCDLRLAICDIESFLANVRKVFERLREFNVAVNPAKTKLDLAEVEYVGHVVSATRTSFTEEKRLRVLKLQFIGLCSYFRDHGLCRSICGVPTYN